MMRTLNIRYGTVLVPSNSKNITREFAPAKDVPYSYTSRPGQSAPPPKGTKLPSISALLGCTSDQTALYRWQKGMISKLGYGGFFKWMSSEVSLVGDHHRVKSGRFFHSAIENLMREAVQANGILRTDKDILRKTDGTVVDFMQSALPILRSLRFSPSSSHLLLQEEATSHHALGYQGRFDAVLPLEEGLTAVDWKTATASSAISTTIQKEGATNLDDLYSYPLQLAAYVGAVNADAKFSNLPQIKRALLVVASDSGLPGKTIVMEEEDLKKYWAEWIRRVESFWRKVAEAEGRDVDWAYNPSENGKGRITPL